MQIRQGVFETNSSSTHSISVCIGSKLSLQQPKLNLDGNLEIDLAQRFGWGIESYNDTYSKLAYLGLYCTQYYIELRPLFEKAIKEYTQCNKIIFLNGNSPHVGYIDHQSYEARNYHDIFNNPEILINFLFNKKSWLDIGNDNDDHELPKRQCQYNYS